MIRNANLIKSFHTYCLQSGRFRAYSIYGHSNTLRWYSNNGRSKSSDHWRKQGEQRNDNVTNKPRVVVPPTKPIEIPKNICSDGKQIAEANRRAFIVTKAANEPAECPTVAKRNPPTITSTVSALNEGTCPPTAMPGKPVFPPEQKFVVPPLRRTAVPPQKTFEVPPIRRTEVPPQKTLQVPPIRRTEAPPQKTFEVPPIRRADVPPQKSFVDPPLQKPIVPPQQKCQVPPEIKTEVPQEQKAFDPPQQKREVPPQQKLRVLSQQKPEATQKMEISLHQKFEALKEQKLGIPPQQKPEIPPTQKLDVSSHQKTAQQQKYEVPPQQKAADPPQKSESSNTTKLSSSDNRASSGGDNKGEGSTKWLLGVLALALGGVATYYLAFNEDDDSKSTPEKKSSSKAGGKNRLSASNKKSPALAEDLPKHVQYLLIGGGAACFSAFRSIKSLDPKAEVLLVTQETEFPYMRPPLSKEMWTSDRDMRETMMFKQWNGSVRSVFFEPDSFYMEPKNLAGSSKGGVGVARGWRVDRVDADNKQAILDDGSVITYDKCLLAPGSKPKALPVIEKSGPAIKDKVFYFRDVFDFRDLSKATEGRKDVVIIGGGFLGSELACSLLHNGCKVTQVFREQGLLAKLLPQYLSNWLTQQVSAEGVQVLANSEVTAVSAEGNRLVFTLSNGRKIDGDICLAATGAVPNTELAENSKLETHAQLGGYLVNSEMLARSNLYIAGDAACFYDERWGRRRVEHHDHAVVSGRLAGENMVGAHKPYTHVSMLWSDLSPDIGWEGVGILDPGLPTTGVFALASAESAEEGKTDAPVTIINDGPSSEKPGEQFSKGVVFYHKDGVIVGVLLWNIFNRMSLARQILKQQYKSEDMNEVAKLFRIHSD